MVIYSTDNLIDDGSKEQAQTKRSVNDNQQRIATLEREVANLSNLVEGMWNLLQSNTQLNDDNLREAITEVIASRKRLREKKRGCKSCARFVSAQYQKCIYCGGELTGDAEPALF